MTFSLNVLYVRSFRYGSVLCPYRQIGIPWGYPHDNNESNSNHEDNNSSFDINNLVVRMKKLNYPSYLIPSESEIIEKEETGIKKNKVDKYINDNNKNNKPPKIMEMEEYYHPSSSDRGLHPIFSVSDFNMISKVNAEMQKEGLKDDVINKIFDDFEKDREKEEENKEEENNNNLNTTTNEDESCNNSGNNNKNKNNHADFEARGIIKKKRFF
jgi:hypothetical protein